MNDLIDFSYSAVAYAYATDAVAASERDAASEFLELVDCAADEVRDIPADRYDVDHRKFGSNEPAAPPRPRAKDAPGYNGKKAKAERRAAKLAMYDKSVWPWGKHRGKMWQDIPVDYLRWFASLEDPYGKTGRHLRHQVTEYIRWKYDA